MRATPTGLADLALVLHALNPQREECAAILRLLALRGELAFDPLPQAPPVRAEIVDAPTPAAQAAQLPPPPAPRPPQPENGGRAFIRPAPRDYRVVEPPRFNTPGLPIKITEVKPPPVGNVPSWIKEAEELDLQSGSARHLVAPTPLIPFAQLRAFIADLIIEPVPGEPDIPKLVEALAQGRLPRVLPRMKRKGAARRIHVLLDTADSMRFFRTDALALLRALDEVVGPALQSEVLTHGAPAAHESIPAVRGDTVIVVSDFGIGSRPAVARLRQRRWRDFAVLQAARGVKITGVVPLHPRRWPTTLTRHIKMVHWHPPGDTAMPATPDQVRRLAVVLSLSAVIDPALLRTARLHLIPGADAGAEVDLINGWWASVRNPRVLAFLQNAMVYLRSQLTADPALFSTARRLLVKTRERDQRAEWNRVRFEEEVVFLALSNNAQDVKNALARVIRSLMGRMRDHASARWALCLLEELPEEVRQLDAAQLLRAVASVILNTDYEAVEEIAAAHDAGWLFRETTPVGVRWNGDALLVRDPPVLADRILTVPATMPRIVIVDDGDRKRVLRVTDGPPAWMYLGHLPVLLKTAAGAEYQLDKNAEGWAAAVRALKEQETLRGVVTARAKGGFRVDIGVDALLRKEQVVFAGLDPGALIGTEIDVQVIAIDKISRLIEVGLASHPMARFSDEAWQEIERRHAEHEPVQAVLVAKSPDAWIVELFGVKLAVAEFERARDRQEIDVGQEVELFIHEIDPQACKVTLSRSSDFVVLKQMLTAMAAKAPVVGTVAKAIKGGCQVDVGIKAFAPAGQMDLVLLSPADRDALVGRTFEFMVLDVSWGRRNVILSRREILERQRDAMREHAYAELVAGTLRQGTVKNITDYGVFVDLNGVDGLLHLSDISWRRVRHPSEYFAVGEEIEVMILAVDKEKARVSLGYKQKTPDPWPHAAERYTVGQQVSGQVTAIMEYGAMVEVEPGVDALIHISEMSWLKKLVHPSKMFTLGQEVAGIITEINGANRRMALSYRALQPNPWATISDRYPIGTVVTGTIRNLTDFGAFVMLEDGIDALIHISDMSWNRRLAHPSELLKKGQTVQGRVIALDGTKQRITLSIREFLPNPWDDDTARYAVGDIVRGPITRIEDFGLFVQLAERVEGLVHLSQIERDPSVELAMQFRIGEEVTVRIIKIDADGHKIGLSMKDVPPQTAV